MVKFDIIEMLSLIGKERPVEEIKEALEGLGMDVEKVEEGEMSVDITPDRMDMLTIEGASRAIANFLGIKEPREYEAERGNTFLNVDEIPVRPAVVAAIVREVEMNEKTIKAMIQAQEKIHETFGRKRKKVAIGIHDFDATSPPFSYRSLKHMTFIPLESGTEMSPQQVLKEHPKGKEYGWIYEKTESYPLILDSKGVVSFPPIINAERTRITEKTKNLFIEITGTSEKAVKDALNVFLTSFADRGAKIENVRLRFLKGEGDSVVFERKEKLDLNFVKKVLGMKFSAEKACELLKKMGHLARKEGEFSLTIDVAPYRADIMHEIDFVEDIAVAHGYQNFKPKLPKILTTGRRSEKSEMERKVREWAISMGFVEVVTWTLTNEEKEIEAGIEAEGATIKNPRTKEFTRFRTSLLPSILTVFSENKTKGLPQKVFEIGRVADEKGNCTTRLCLAITSEKTGFSDIKGAYEAINKILHTSYAEGEFEFLISGRAISILTQKKKEKIGWCGEIHPKILEKFSIENPVTALEMELK